jgi:hypothetical protein
VWFRSLETAGVASPDVAYEYVGELRMGDEDDEQSSRGMDTDNNARAGVGLRLADSEPILVWLD